MELLIPTFFKKRTSLEMRGQKLFGAKKLWGGCSKLKDYRPDHAKVWEELHK